MQSLLNKVLHKTGNFPWCTLIHELLVVYNIPHMYEFITILRRQQAAVIQNHDKNVGNIGQGKVTSWKYQRLQLGSSQAYDCSIPGRGSDWVFFSLPHCIQTGSGAHPASYPGVRLPGCEVDHSPPSSSKVKNAWSYTSTSPIRLHWVVLS